MTANTSQYDEQALTFDNRAGFTHPQCQQIVEAIEQLSHPKPDSVFIEIGCGTGQIGSLLALRCHHYLGFDLSSAMLRQFKHRDTANNISLIQADCNKTWPVTDHIASTFFSSRAIHWINVDHIINEIYRIAGKGHAMLFIGRAERAPDSWESQLRKQCHRLLKQYQLTPRDADHHLKLLCDKFHNRKAEVLKPFIVSQWQQQRSLQQSLKDWSNKTGLAGTKPSGKVKQHILAQLKQWSYDEFGSEPPTKTARQYILHGIKFIV